MIGKDFNHGLELFEVREMNPTDTFGIRVKWIDTNNDIPWTELCKTEWFTEKNLSRWSSHPFEIYPYKNEKQLLQLRIKASSL